MDEKRNETLMIAAWIALVLQVVMDIAIVFALDAECYPFDQESVQSVVLHVFGPVSCLLLVVKHYGLDDIPPSHLPNLLALFLLGCLECFWALLFLAAE